MVGQVDLDEFDASQELRLGRLCIEDIDAVSLLEDWQWHKRLKIWYIKVGITIPTASSFVPKFTEWFLTAESTYPWGTIRVYPSKTNSITHTFHHQIHNGFGLQDTQWRSGYICLDVPDFILPRMGDRLEPYDAETRLEWQLLRAVKWIESASEDALVKTGDDFEIPDFCGPGHPHVSFVETKSMLEPWMRLEKKYGKVLIAHPNDETLICKSFLTMNGELLTEVPFKKKFDSRDHHAYWVLFDNIPVVKPWGAPMTWKELESSISVEEYNRLIATIKKATTSGTFGPLMLLVGFPIPDKIGHKPTIIWWQPMYLPEIGKRKNIHRRKGKPNDLQVSWTKYQANHLSDEREVKWMRSQNWSEEAITSRGSFPEHLRNNKIIVAGAGALGSIISEILSRGGIKHINIIDYDRIEAGNLVRHTALTSDINKLKSEVIADRVNLASIYGQAVGINGSIPTNIKDPNNKDASIIIDTTGSDDLIESLCELDFEKEMIFISVWIGYEAKRTYIFTMKATQFNKKSFRDLTQTWLHKESQEFSDLILPREGIGCWHPVFPARFDEMLASASITTQYLTDFFEDILEPHLAIFEQTNENGFTGYKRIL